jgi:predicted amidohydrolase YtcJ
LKIYMHALSLLLGLLPAAVGLAAEPAADLVLVNGRVHTQDAARRVVAAIAIRGTTIVATGTADEIRAFVGPATRSVDLAGRVVLPGFIDAHTHPAQSAQDFGKCNLGDQMLAASAVVSAAAACYRTMPGDPAQWFQVVQVNPSGLVLSLVELDSIVRDRPMVLMGSDGHTTWANSAALHAAGITSALTDPAGGRIERAADGNPTGTLRDAASDQVLAIVPSAGKQVETARLGHALAEMNAAGITSVQDAAVGDHEMSLYKALYDEGRLTMRVRGSYTITDLAAPGEKVALAAKAFRDRWAVDPNRLRADAIKIFADGVIEFPSQTAELLEPYLDADGHPTGNRGPTYYRKDNLNRIVAAVDAAGLTVHIHAIGDRAIRDALDAFAYARAHGSGTGNRDQIAHLELIDPADFTRFKSLGVIANFQLLWARRDSYVAEATEAFIGPERSKHLYPARSLLDAGATLAGGSDWGVSSFNVFDALEHAVTRGDPALLPEQSIPLQAALDSYTVNAAFALRQEGTTGSIEPGKRADAIVLDRDMFALDPRELHNVKILATYLDGREVYAAPGWR